MIYARFIPSPTRGCLIDYLRLLIRQILIHVETITTTIDGHKERLSPVSLV